jgi:membrane-associated phospholipid phosphatase
LNFLQYDKKASENGLNQEANVNIWRLITAMAIFAAMIFSEIMPGMYIPEGLKQLDYFLFSKINGEWHNAFFDNIIPFIRESYLWLPFYFFLILFTTLNFKIKGWYWVLFFIINAMLSDFVSSSLIKESLVRLRPCHDPLLADKIRFLVSYCPVSSSFTSSHAANHFAAAMFIFTTFKKAVSAKWVYIFLWAFFISYAQVYVGVHFPLDIFCGAIVGLILGYIPAKIFNTRIGLEGPELTKKL